MDAAKTPAVDLIVLSRSAGPLRPEVENGIRAQQGVSVIVHRVVGEARASDRCRWETIARARNSGKQLGTASWLMFLDDDVVLTPDCIFTLLNSLRERPIYAALGANYSDQQHPGQIAGHVSMGATLFRRQVLEQIEFRWSDERCECQCCCDDLRRMLWAIDYLPAAGAVHLTPNGCFNDQDVSPLSSVTTEYDNRVIEGGDESPSVCLVACYFGSLPGWIEYYLRSCAGNPTINFLLFSDCEDLPEVPPNVRLVQLTQIEFERLATHKLGFEVSLSHARKLCDFKPLYGDLFSEYLTNWDYWGYTDLDVIYGDLRRYLTAAKLAEYDVFTARREFLVGHFTLVRNTEALRRLYEQSHDFRETLVAPQVGNFDECGDEWQSRLEGNLHAAESFDCMTHVVSRLEQQGKLRVCFAPCVLEWPELGMTDWKVHWEDGRLRLVSPARDVMYCHFHAFKHQLGYKLPPHLGDKASFELTAIGIGPPAQRRTAKADRLMLPSVVG